MRRLTLVAAVPDPPWDHGGRACRADDDRVGALGDDIVSSLFLAGMDLCSALGLVTDEPVRARLEQAVTEIDDAIKGLRHLMLAVRAEQADPGISGR